MKPAFFMLVTLLLSSGTGNTAEEMVDLYLKEARKQLTAYSARAAAAAADSRCYRCGVCCKEMPCRYGEWDAVRHQCIHLKVDAVTADYTTYTCNKYNEIVKQDQGRALAVFGGGCVNSMHNQAREKIRSRVT